MTNNRTPSTGRPSSRNTSVKKRSPQFSPLPIWLGYALLAGLIFWRLSGFWLPLLINLVLFLAAVRLIGSLRRRQASLKRRQLRPTNRSAVRSQNQGAARSQSLSQSTCQSTNPLMPDSPFATEERPRGTSSSRREISLPFDTAPRPLPAYDPETERQQSSEEQSGATGSNTRDATTSEESWQAHLRQLNARIEESRKQMEAEKREQLAREARERHIHQELKVLYPEKYESQQPQTTQPAKEAPEEKEHPFAGEEVSFEEKGIKEKTGTEKVDNESTISPEKESFSDEPASPEKLLQQTITFSGKTSFKPAHQQASAPDSSPDSSKDDVAEPMNPADKEPRQATQPSAQSAAQQPSQKAPLSREIPVPVPVQAAGNLRQQIIESDAQPPRPYRQPPLYLLQRSEETAPETDEEALLEQAILLEETLESFGVKAKVNHVTRGPAITRFELQPERGVKVSKITGLSDDIALNMAARTIRIEAPIPGKAAIGIELPNEETAMVSFREMVESPLYHQFLSPLPFALGKNIAGEPVVFDLAKAPHLLIAGATGSGKSVCINTLILSILYSAHPDQVKLLLIDPKVVELNRYNGIPHLMAPVVSDPKKATAALKWAVKEMEGRYQAFAEKGVRDIAGYNNKTPEDPMYWMVIIIDELADLMMVAAREVEDSICRLAQMARAAGIHLVIATQRPSVDVITGLIKANIPSRIAFSVASQIDSRTILDMAGAEKLLGRGDMLFYPTGASQPMRVQGAFLTDDEVMDTVNHLRQFDSENQLEEALQEEMRTAAMEPEEENETESEEVFEQALRLAFEQQQISISMLQRKLRMGFNRAARLIDEMEEKGYVGPSEGTKPRKVISATGRVSPQEGTSSDDQQDNTDIPITT
ncbi:DNA translocase FtsK [Anoxynatronum buryatiense]|uniref:DNA segregation ATPase FtsK/SpoIIIE n=1 Tax=Anoxynatronum buryatiense TaxID=489973 RepID=A0AA45WXS5_9CLOT|nr:DNA translocase FtsK [Anoxynatronum buryatiense]SMP66025.1 DNA segregation ATPase FtsK/SpoIIIE [Anoxynatronum buryatiense]